MIAAAACVFALPSVASALLFHIGGTDAESQYTGAGTGHADAGILTFDDSLNGNNNPEPGVVTSSDIAAFLGLSVAFEVVLGPDRRIGGAFDPATDNLKLARFVGTGGNEFRFFDGAMTLLSFDISYIDVSNATTAFAGVDPDGSITLGDPTETSTSSLLTVSGGSLNQLVGGVGTEARLQVQFVTITPAILNNANFKGYLNDNFSSGFGAQPISASTWDLTIIPEPSTAALMGFALLGLVAAARRQSRGGA